ncbi:MAG TPA: hypothetical protein V6D04_05480 [Candidatus Obscuribacterales bacterium]
MALVKKSDLQFDDYDWTAAKEHDNPVETHFPDNRELARKEGYEVLHYLNRVAELSKWTTKAPVLKLERMLRKLPGDIRSFRKIHDWVVANWNNHS